MTGEAKKPPLSLPQLGLTALYLLSSPILLFLLAGNWYWIEGWIYSILFVGFCAFCVAYLYVRDPALLKERFSSAYQKGQSVWDKVFLTLFMLFYYVWF